jgi:lipopolysaccharide export system permease protein
MNILDRYIIKKILSTFVFVMLILIAIIVVIDLTEKIDKFTKNELGAAVIASYYLDYVPWIAGFISPIIIFIAIVYVTSRLAAHTEIIAMLSSGISFMRLLWPYFLSALLLATISFLLNGWVIPKSNRERVAFEMEYVRNKVYSDKSNVHMQVEPNVYLYLQNYNGETNTGYQFTLERFENNTLVDKLTADNIAWDSTKQKWTLRFWRRRLVDSLFQAKNVVRETPSTLTSRETQRVRNVQRGRRPQAASPSTIEAGKISVEGAALDTAIAILPEDFQNEERKYDGMTITELNHHIAKLRFRGSTGVEVFEVEKHIRFASPFTIFVLVFMGVIVSARKSRGGTGFQIALGFFLAFVFILFFMLTRTFAEAGSISPMLAAWIPNIIFTVVSLGMYRYVPR